MTSSVRAPAGPSQRLIRSRFQQTIDAGEAYFAANADAIAACASAMADRFFEGGRLLVFGAGSGTTDAQHNSVEYVHPVLTGCRALPALSLTNDGATVTGILLGDDPASVFAHQVRVLGRPGDMAIAFADVPTAAAITRGLEAAEAGDLLTVALLTGSAEGRRIADHQFEARSDDHMTTQELHLATYHMLWELVHIVLNHRGIPRGSASPEAFS
ncbi:MAG: SIS domain-containing protein [Candidatus Dormibacteria bacterium]